MRGGFSRIINSGFGDEKVFNNGREVSMIWFGSNGSRSIQFEADGLYRCRVAFSTSLQRECWDGWKASSSSIHPQTPRIMETGKCDIEICRSCDPGPKKCISVSGLLESTIVKCDIVDSDHLPFRDLTMSKCLKLQIHWWDPWLSNCRQ